jgi:hypothetical protein
MSGAWFVAGIFAGAAAGMGINLWLAMRREASTEACEMCAVIMALDQVCWTSYTRVGPRHPLCSTCADRIKNGEPPPAVPWRRR